MAKEIQVKVSGMVCSMCAQGIQKKFSKFEQIEKIKVDLDQKIVSISTKENQDLSNEKITDVITEAGYNVTSIQR
jgi:periplasmic mercuric ion binding protein